ncbi:hypothetical protein ABPG74_017471 [Tetrahymena malaccensis]
MKQYIQFKLLLIFLNFVFSSGQICPQGQGFDPYQNQCFMCAQNCQSCQIGFNPSSNSFTEQSQTCQQCQTAFYLSEDQTSCLSNCEYYFDSQQNQCQQCQIEGCLICATQYTCQKCSQNFQLKNGLCVSDCQGQQQYLNQSSQCSYQCGIGQIRNDQSSICQSINKCPIQYSESNYCHTYQVIYQQTILSIEKYIDNNSQEIMVSYDNIGNIKFWKYTAPVIDFLSEIQPTLSNHQYYLCVYPQYIQAFDLNSPQVQEIHALNQSPTGSLYLFDIASYNGIDYVCIQSEQDVLLFEVINIFNDNSSLDWYKNSIQFSADSSYSICIVFFKHYLIFLKQSFLKENWIDSNGNTQTGVLYKQQQAICHLYNQYYQISRVTEQIYILIGANNYSILILSQKSVQSCQEFIIQNMDTQNYYVSFLSSQTKLILILQNQMTSYNNLSYKLYNITSVINGETQINEITNFQQNTEMIFNQILGDTLFYAQFYISNLLFQQDLNLLTIKTYYFNAYFYNIHIVDSDVIIITDENNIVSLILNDNQSYNITRQTTCKTQNKPNYHLGSFGTNIFDQQAKQYALQGFQETYQLRDMRNGNIILSTSYTQLYQPLQNKLKNKIYLFQFGGLIIIDFSKKYENESEFIMQINMPRAFLNGIPFFDSDENFYIYNFDNLNWKSIVAYTSNGQLIKEIPARLDLTYSIRFTFFCQLKKIVCLVDQTDAILSYFDFINLVTYDFSLFQGKQAESILQAYQINDENIIFITANNMFITDFLGAIIQQIQYAIYSLSLFAYYQNNNLIIIFQQNVINFVDTQLNPLQIQYSTYGKILYQIVYGDYILASYDSQKIQIIYFPSSSETIIVTSQAVSQLITFYDQIHFGFFQGLTLKVYSLYQGQVKQVFQIQQATLTCQQQYIQYFDTSYLDNKGIYIDQDNSGICNIYGNSGLASSQIQMKVPGQMYLDYLSLSQLNYTNLASYIDVSADKIYFVLSDSQNNMFFCSVLYKSQLNINVIAQIQQPTLTNVQGIQSYGVYQMIYYDNGFIIYKNGQILQMIDSIPSQINQFILDFQEDVLAISNTFCQWFVFQISTGFFMYQMPQDINYNSALKCTLSFDRVNKNLLLKQTKQITSFSYSQNKTNWFLTTQNLGNTNMVSLYSLDQLNLFYLVTNPCIAVVYTAPSFKKFNYYAIVFQTTTFVKQFYDSYNQRIILCNQDYKQCQIYNSQFKLIKTISFIKDIDIDQLWYYEHPINVIIAPNQNLLIQMMYLDDQYKTSAQQIISVDISQYSQTFSQYNQLTQFNIIEDFQKDILIVVFADNVFFIQISQTQIIHYLNFQENLSKSQTAGNIKYISLDKQRNILTCVTQENVIIYDYSSIAFYDYQNFYLGPQNGDLISYIPQANNQNDNLIVFAREFNYNQISFYQIQLQKQIIAPFLSLDVTQNQDLQFTLKGDSSGQIGSSIKNMIKYNYRIIQVQKQTSSELQQYIIIQHHVLRYCIYQLNNSNMNFLKIYYYQSNNYQYYTLLEELNFFPVLLLQSTINSTLYLQILDNQSNIISLVSNQFNQAINDCSIRNQTIYCFDQQGINLITIDIQNPNSFSLIQLNQLDQQLNNQNITFAQNIVQNITNMPLVFYCNSMIFSWNPIEKKISKLQMANNIQQLLLGNFYILLELQNTFDLQLAAINQDGALMQTLYSIQLPAQRLRNLSSSGQIPLFYNYKYEEPIISEQISQFLVLQTFGQANIYSLLDFSLYLTVRSFNLTNISQIQILSKSIMLIASKTELDVYYFTQNNYQLLQSFQVSLPIIGYAVLNPQQQQNIYQLSIVISSNYDIRLLSYTLDTNKNSNTSSQASNQQCALTFSNYVQDLSLLEYSVKIQAIQEEFISKNYATIQILEIYFIPLTSIYLRQDIFSTLQSSNFTLRLYSDSQNALVYLINQNYNNINNIFNPSIVNLEILNMRLTIPQQPQNSQLITPIIIDINNSTSINYISIMNTIIDLDSQICITFQNMSELIISNTEFITSQHLINGSSQNECMILIKNVNTVYLDTLTFNNFTMQNKQSSSLQYIIAFDTIQTINLSNIQIQNTNIEINSIFSFQNIGNLTVNNILVNSTISSGSIISCSNINTFSIQMLQIYNSSFIGDSYSIINLMGVLINNLQNITFINSSGPSFILIQEQFYNQVIVIVTQVTINNLQMLNSQFKDQQNPSIFIQSLNAIIDNISIEKGTFTSDVIQFYSNVINIQNSVVKQNQIYSSLLIINSFQHQNLGQQLDTQSCLIQYSQFNNNNLQIGQVLYIFQHQAITFNQLVINMNTLLESFYGTVTFDTSSNIVINNSVFTNNSVQKGCGGAVYITNSQVQLNNCTISSNYAIIGGGIRYQGLNSSLVYKNQQNKYRHLDVQQSDIFNNKALLFGQQITSYPKLIKFDQNYTTILSQLVSGNTLIQPIIFYLVDEFEDVVNYPQSIEANQIHQLIIQEFQGYDILVVNQNQTSMHIQGSIQIFRNYITFQPQIISYPSSSQFLSFQLSSNVPIYDFQSNNFQLSSIKSTIELDFLPCQVGQIPKQQLNLIQCYECPQGNILFSTCFIIKYLNHFQTKKIGTYSFVSQFSDSEIYQCSGCPQQASYCEKDMIVLQDGYWRLNPQSIEVFQCSNPSNCIQTQNQKNYNFSSQMSEENFVKSICLVGHIGALCESCDINNLLWSERYSKSSNLSCMKCSENYLDIVSYFLLYLATLCYLSFCFRKIKRFTTQKCLYLYIKRMNFLCIGKSSESDQNTVATKILINYVQIITIIFQFANFSQYVKQVVSIFGDSQSDTMMSIDCILITSLEVGNILTRRSILRILFPLTFLFLFALGIYIFRGKNSKRLCIYDIKCSFIFLWLFFSPSIINYFVQQLSCIQIGDYSYVMTDKQFICLGDDHKQNIIFVLIPSLVLLYLILPFYFLFQLKQKRNALNKIQNIKVYGILFYEYRKEKYYWEIIKTTQKSLIYLCTFFNNIGQKAFISLTVLLLYGLTSFFSKPYNSIQLNNLDLMATILQFTSIVLSIIINLMNNTIWESISISLIFFFNFVFIVKILVKVILRDIPLDPQQRNLFHWFLIKLKSTFPKFLTNQIIIQSSNQLQVMRRWGQIQKQVFSYMKLKRKNINDQQKNNQADEIIEGKEEHNNLIITMNQQTSIFGISNSSPKFRNSSQIILKGKMNKRNITEREHSKGEKFQLLKTDYEFINYFDENSTARSPNSFFTKRQSKNINLFESQQTQEN